MSAYDWGWWTGAVLTHILLGLGVWFLFYLIFHHKKGSD